MSNTTETIYVDKIAIAENKEIALAFLKYAYGGEVSKALAYLTDDTTWWVIGKPGRLKISGLKDRKFAERLLVANSKAMPEGMAYKITGVTAEGDRVAVECAAEGMWSNGKIYANTYHFLFEIHGGKIRAIREYMDTLAVHDLIQD